VRDDPGAIRPARFSGLTSTTAIPYPAIRQVGKWSMDIFAAQPGKRIKIYENPNMKWILRHRESARQWRVRLYVRAWVFFFWNSEGESETNR